MARRRGEWTEATRGARQRHPRRIGATKGDRSPSIQAEGITAAKISKLDITSEVEGYYPEHLPLKFKPQLIKKARRTAIRRDRDIPNSVFTPDTRYIFRDTSFPWCTTGKVVTEDGSCTGTMVGRRLMLTAGHCIKWTANGAGWIKFTPFLLQRGYAVWGGVGHARHLLAEAGRFGWIERPGNRFRLRCRGAGQFSRRPDGLHRLPGHTPIRGMAATTGSRSDIQATCRAESGRHSSVRVRSRPFSPRARPDRPDT